MFCLRNSKQNSPVLIFVHGGYWNSGRGTYDLLGRNFARKGVTIIPDYTLSPNTDYDG
jgi:acetyl esterase/lipase